MTEAGYGGIEMKDKKLTDLFTANGKEKALPKKCGFCKEKREDFTPKQCVIWNLGFDDGRLEGRETGEEAGKKAEQERILDIWHAVCCRRCSEPECDIETKAELRRMVNYKEAKKLITEGK